MHIAAAALVLLLCRAGADEGRATVVRDGRAGPGNPAVESGGHHLPRRQSPPPVPYSLIGAIDTANQVCRPDAGWSSGWFGWFPTHRHFGWWRTRPWFERGRVNFTRFR